mmetsp:Transcript_826/g.1299  ORF Transcript_826/g.1299 Transcript_826/m.1299 type:complete len:233 (+) Transcript_826:13-711(+)
MSSLFVVVAFAVLAVVVLQATDADALQLFFQRKSPDVSSSLPSTSVGVSRRRLLVDSSAAAGAALCSGLILTSSPLPSEAATKTDDKLYNLSKDELASMIYKDVTENQFLVTGHLTRSIYDESATFQDEIDTYRMDDWIKGTAKLFVASKSHVTLPADSIRVTESAVEFPFQETLCFNIPLLFPTVNLSGKIRMERTSPEEGGLIVKYRELWDQDVPTVLSSVQWFGGSARN